MNARMAMVVASGLSCTKLIDTIQACPALEWAALDRFSKTASRDFWVNNISEETSCCQTRILRQKRYVLKLPGFRQHRLSKLWTWMHKTKHNNSVDSSKNSCKLVWEGRSVAMENCSWVACREVGVLLFSSSLRLGLDRRVWFVLWGGIKAAQRGRLLAWPLVCASGFPLWARFSGNWWRRPWEHCCCCTRGVVSLNSLRDWQSCHTKCGIES